MEINIFTQYYPSVDNAEIHSRVGLIPDIIVNAFNKAKLDDIEDIKKCIDKEYGGLSVWLDNDLCTFKQDENFMLYLHADDLELKPFATFTYKDIDFYVYSYGIVAFVHKNKLLVVRLD